ncbi:2-oxo acid dehydrogenase subunit E2 [bacterium]|nr:2-oxo acid dehydrogenase subunit E2 [bacterium]
MKNLDLKQLKNTSPFRKIAMGTWNTAKDPSVYGIMELDLKKVQDLLPEYQKKHDIKITPAHLIGRAYSLAIKNRPEINSMIRGSKIYLRPSVSLFYQVNVPGKKDASGDQIKKATLSGAVIKDAGSKSTHQISSELKAHAAKIRAGQDKEMKNSMGIFKYLPWCLAKPFLNISSFLMYGLNLNLSALGVPRDPFGSVMITNVGSLGIDLAFAPLCPYTRVPLLFTIGAISDKAWVVDGKVEVRPILPLVCTFDHRIIDGIHASQIAKDFKTYFAEPEKYLLTD